MAQLEITKMSSKGQIVIPQEMRKGFHEGEKFVVMKAGKQLILKSIEDFDENIEEDLKFARRTEEAWKKYEQGEFKSLPVDKFLEELDKC
ncbi:MAG: AbrB/MazE/SpoVT family DNA-binding domain-containing protein [Nanoarchaeota archaeon]|nr:AbrB/MazE/SpoVT family DNA-binding domain-containing protein [Nanoarchaeota archaeon]